MKSRLLAATVTCVRPFALLFYGLVKALRPPRHKVTFISRQGCNPSVDFSLIATDLVAADHTLRTKMLCCSDEDRRKRFAGTFRQTVLELWHIANSQAVVLDGYAVSVSYFAQRPSLYVVQIWHAMGAFKRFSWQALDTPGGRDSRLARALRMHANYSVILCGAEASREIFRHAFHAPRVKIHIAPLPRVDVLKRPDPNRIDHIITTHPELFEKAPLIAYIPTFRDTQQQQQQWLRCLAELRNAAEKQGACLVVKTHPRDTVGNDSNTNVETLDLLCLADHVVTDYSAVAFEAAVAGKPLWFYLPDRENYVTTRGLNINPEKEMPESCFTDAEQLVDALLHTPLPTDAQKEFLQKYVQLPGQSVSATKQIVRLISVAIQ